MLFHTDDISIEILVEKANLPLRVYNLCMRNGLTSIRKVMDHYNAHKTLNAFPGIGLVAETRLITTIREYTGKSDLVLKNEKVKSISREPRKKKNTKQSAKKKERKVGSEKHTPGIQQLQEKKLNYEKEPGYTLFYKGVQILRTLSTEEEVTLYNQIDQFIELLSASGKSTINLLIKKYGSIQDLLPDMFKDEFSFKALKSISREKEDELNLLRVNIEDVLIGIKSLEYKKKNEIVLVQKPVTPGRLPAISKLFDEVQIILRHFPPGKTKDLIKLVDDFQANLGTRAYNGFHLLLRRSTSIEQCLMNVFTESFDFKTIRNVGSQAAEELYEFRSRLEKAIIEYWKGHIVKPGKKHTILALINKTCTLLEPIEPVCDQLFDEKERINLFKLIHFLISEKRIFTDKDLEIFVSLFQRNYNSIDEIAHWLAVSKKKAHQLKQDFYYKRVIKYFHFISCLDLSEIYMAGWESFSASELIAIDNETVNAINTKQGLTFNKLFYTRILSILFEKTHTVLNDCEITGDKDLKKLFQKFNRYYLIKNDLFQSFDFGKFLKDLYNKVNENISEDYSIHFEGYLCTFLKSATDRILPSNIKNICDQIILHEFDMISMNACLTFSKSIKRSTKLFIDETGMHSTGPVKKKSTLKKDSRAETIRRVVEKFLCEDDEPRHISEIMNYLVKHYPANKDKVLAGIKQDKRFIVYVNEFIGLINKPYDKNKINFKRLIRLDRTFLQRFSGLTYDEIVRYYTQAFGYKRVQISSLLDKMIDKGEIIINKDKTINLYDQN